jgi:type I restriction enzyme S subunit
MSVANGWSEVSLGRLLTKSDEMIELDPQQEYKEITVRLWGRGVALRRIVTGAEIASTRRNRVHANEFILSRIDARNGAMGLVPEALDGAVVSSDFPVFSVDTKRLLPVYIGWLCRTQGFVDSCRHVSEGTTNRVRLREEKFYQLKIPLPPLEEQRRIVAKIEHLAAKIDDAHGLRNLASIESHALLRTGARQALEAANGHDAVSLESVCSEIIDCLHSNPVYSDSGTPTLRSPDIGWGRLLLDTARRTDETEFRRRTRRGEPMPGDVILVREGGGTGKAGIVEEGQKVSLGQRVMQLRPNPHRVVPRFLLHQWLSPQIQQDQIAERMKGSASPHLNISALRKFSFILPPLAEQHRIVAYLDSLQAKVDELKRLQAQTAAELDALLPSLLDRAFKGQL